MVPESPGRHHHSTGEKGPYFPAVVCEWHIEMDELPQVHRQGSICVLAWLVGKGSPTQPGAAELFAGVLWKSVGT